MKFIYVDESGSQGEGDVFVMCGLMVDAYNLRKKTAYFDTLFENLKGNRLGRGKELKTKRFIEGKSGWSKIMSGGERQDFITTVCKLAVDTSGELFGIGLSFNNFAKATNSGYGQPFGCNHWVASSMFIGALVQKKMQKMKSNKGSTVIIMDGNWPLMPQLSDGLYNADSWYDPLYQKPKRRGASVWIARKPEDRFDQIINTAFGIKSNHSTLIQVSDVICYVYRRHLELKDSNIKEKYQGERTFYEGLIAILEPQREKLGQTPTGKSVDFYKAACHPHWKI